MFAVLNDGMIFTASLTIQVRLAVFSLKGYDLWFNDQFSFQFSVFSFQFSVGSFQLEVFSWKLEVGSRTEVVLFSAPSSLCAARTGFVVGPKNPREHGSMG